MLFLILQIGVDRRTLTSANVDLSFKGINLETSI